MPFALIDTGDSGERTRRLVEIMERNQWSLPVILKPDAAQRGAGLKLLREWSGAEAYFAQHPAPTLVQQYHPGPFEAGIFYCRRPGQTQGWIVSITDKEFPQVIGDGTSTVEELIWRHPRLRMQAKTFLARLDEQAEEVLAEGECLRLAVAGNHCQGTLFRDGAHLITPALEKTIDEIAQTFDGLYFGRFDVRYADVDEFRAGKGFSIVELNGATAESTNIYDPSWPLWRAYRQLFEQWKLAYEIGALNRQRGHGVTRVVEVWSATRAYYRGRKMSLIAD